MSVATAKAIRYSHTVGMQIQQGRGFHNPMDLAIGKDGRWYVINRSNAMWAPNSLRIGMCTVDEEFLGDFGYFSTQLASTYFSKYEYSSFGNEPVDGVGLQNGQTNLAPPLPQWKHNFRAAWVLGNHNAAIAAKFLDSVKFDAAAAPGAAIPDRISSYTTYDARYGYTFDSLSFGRLDFGIGVVNLTNAMPDRLPVVGGLETRLGDPFGRQYYAELNFSFE